MITNFKKLTARTFYGTCTIRGTEGPRKIKESSPEKIPLIFFRTAAGGEPVREWLKGLPETERRTVGKDLLRAQWRWPAGMPLCRPMGMGLWEIRTGLPTERTARVLVCVYRGHLVALHGFIKKTRATPDEDLALARKRQKELMR
jgi:phage-related protein